MCERRDGDGFIFGVFLGAAVGGLLGILFAPEEGTKTREKLKRRLEEDSVKGRELAREVSEKVAEVREKAEPIISEMREKLQPVLEKIESLSEPVKEEVASYVEELKDEIGEKVDDMDGMKKRFFKGIKRPS